MDSRGIYDTRENREGLQFEAFFRLLAFTLQRWVSPRSNPQETELVIGRRKKSEEHPECDCLQSIYFDKLSLLLKRLWTEAFKLTGDRHRPEAGEEIEVAQAEYVTFPAPVTELPGIHGRGTGIKYEGRRKPLYITNLVRRLSEDGIMRYFYVYSADNDKISSDDPFDHRVRVQIGEPITNTAEFLDDFTSGEIAVAQDIAHAIARLSASEIRCLGTHENAVKTIEDIVYEFEFALNLVDSVNIPVQDLNRFSTFSNKMAILAEEACRKSFLNRDDYSSGLERLGVELRGPIVKQALQTVQTTAKKIWDHAGVSSLVSTAQWFATCANYLRLVTGPGRKSSDEELANLSAKISKKIGIGLINSKTAVLRKDGSISDVAQQSFAAVVDELRSVIESALNSHG